jgi:hypothetical protein
MTIAGPFDDSRQPSSVTIAGPIGSAVSWAAILAGAAASAALSLSILALGAGLGLSSISPWSYAGVSAKALGAGTVIWMLVTSLCASGLGGYIAGRLRAKWSDADADESHFRDTAHGYLAWAVATLIGASVLASAASSMVGTIAKASAAAVAAGASTEIAGNAGGPSISEMRSYFSDMMLRTDKPVDANGDITRALHEVNTIFANASAGDIAQADRTYLAQIVASRTGLSPTEAEQRVNQTVAAAKAAMEAASTKAKEAAETARKLSMYTALWDLFHCWSERSTPH